MVQHITANTPLLYSLLLLASLSAFCTGSSFPNVEVQFVNGSTGWIVGPRLIGTKDGGKTWVELRRDGLGTVEAEDILQGKNWIQFTSPETGWSVGGSGVAKTTDGGLTWTSTVITAGEDQSLQSLFFITPREGWVVGADVYYTSDGGQRWERLSKTPAGDVSRQRSMRVAPSFATYKPALWFTDARNGLMARLDGEIYSTRDSGRTWEIRWSGDKSIADIFFIDGKGGWVVGDEGFIARTDDGGQSWVPVSSPTKADLTSIFFLDKQLGWAVGSESTILFTKDGGTTWKAASVSGLWGAPPLASVSFADALHGWAVGGNSDPMRPSLFAPSNVILTTADGGQTWRSIQLELTAKD